MHSGAWAHATYIDTRHLQVRQFLTSAAIWPYCYRSLALNLAFLKMTGLRSRDMTGFRSEIYAFMDVAGAKDIHEMGVDETQVDGISTCNLWVRVTNTLDQVTQLHVLIQVKCICDAYPPSID